MAKKTKKKSSRFNPRQRLIVILVVIAAVILGAILIGRTVSQQQMAVLPAEIATNTTAALPAEVTPVQAAQMQTEGAFILDVRQPDEWAEVHIEGATLIPLTELENRLAELPRDQKIVVVCRSGNRSAQGRDTLLENGFSQVTSMAGGMNAWQAAGLPTTSGN
jgi:rhodanese-related sulfurtransferase